MKKITLNLFVMLFACCFWQLSAQTFNGGGLPSPIFGPGSTGSCVGTNGNSSFESDADASSLTGVIGSNVGDYQIAAVDLDISHTWSGDLEINLIAPDGTTTLNLSDTNGGSTDDAYSGTTFADGGADITAAPTPYSGTYAPEGGAFATAFDGQNVSGNWTLEVLDNVGGDCAVVNSYSITFSEVTAIECAGVGPTTLDGAPGTVTTVTLPFSNMGTIGAGMTDMFTLDEVLLDELQYNRVDELSVTLTSPAGTEILLFANDGGNSANMTARDIVFTDESMNDVDDWDGGGSFETDFMAEGGSLNDAFDGEEISGDWILTITNGGSNPGGTLGDFCLTITNNGLVGSEPTIECPMDITADNDEDACGAIVNFADAIALDAEDGPITATQVDDGAPASGEEFPVGTTTVTFEATDSNGNTVMCSFDVTVNDATDPVLECPEAILVANDPGTCEATVTVPAPTITDNCEDAQPGTLVNDYNGTDDASDVYPVGTTTVEFTYTDAGGNTATCTVDVTVEDMEAPEVLCEGQNNDTVSGSDAPGAVIAVADITSVITIAEDQIITDANVDLDISHEWIGDVQATLTSPAGTSVLIYDGPANSAGIFGCSGQDMLATLDDEGTASIDDTCDAGSVPAISGTLIPSNPLSAFDGESTMGDWTLTIVDTFTLGDDGVFNSWGLDLMFDPITLPPLVVELDDEGNGSIMPEDLVVSATDNCGGVTVSAGGVTTEGGCDLMGELDASDDTWDRPIGAGPSITGLGPVAYDVYGPFTVDMDGTYVMSSDQSFDGYLHLYEMAFDPADQLTNLLAGDDDGPGGIGTSEIEFALVSGTEYFLITSGFSATSFGTYTNTITGPGMVSCGSGDPATIDFTCEDVGINAIDVTVTDDAGNEAFCTANVDVQDNIDPVIACQDFTLELEDDGTATLDPLSLIDMDNSIEACGFDIVTADVTEFDCSNIGTPTMVTVFVQDPSGNIASCSAMVDVVDVNGPVLTCPEDQVRETMEGTGTYTMEDFTGMATATDGCSDTVVLAQDPAVGTALGVGEYTVTITGTDELGNESTCTFNLQVDFLGVDENELSNAIAMYPNPATEIVNLSNTSNIALDRAAIYDVNGKLVSDVNLDGMIGERAIDVSTLATGVYIVQISGEGTTIAKRLIIE